MDAEAAAAHPAAAPTEAAAAALAAGAASHLAALPRPAAQDSQDSQSEAGALGPAQRRGVSAWLSGEDLGVGRLPAARWGPLPLPDCPLGLLGSEYAGLLCAPATLRSDPDVAHAFRAMLAREGGYARAVLSDSRAESAAAVLPECHLGTASPLGDCSPLAEALYEAALRAARGQGARAPQDSGGGAPRPAYNGHLAGDGLGLEHAAYHTAQDMARAFFPPGQGGAPAPRRFYHAPPLGFALAGFGHVAYVAAVEWVGKLLVSPLTQPFLLESRQHAAALAALPGGRYAAPLELGAAEAAAADWALSASWQAGGSAIAWRVSGGRFRKVLRASARTPAQFARLARAYAALGAPRLQADALALALAQTRRGCCPATAATAALLAGLPGMRLLFGQGEVLVDMPALAGRPCTHEEVLGGGAVTDAAARALAWLAVRGVLYTDLRGPNVLLREGEGGSGGSGGGGGGGGGAPALALVDFDDCLVVEAGGALVRSVEGFKAGLVAWVEEEGLAQGTFAVLLLEGQLPQFEAALEAAFEWEAQQQGQEGGGRRREPPSGVSSKK